MVTQRIKKFTKHVMSDSLYRNSLFMIGSTAIMSLFGFIFWMIASRIYTASDIGLATAIISVMGLITGLSVLGLNVGLIRYLPTAKGKNKNRKINTCFTLVILMSIMVTSLYLVGISKFSPALIFIKENVILSFAFIIFMAVAAASSIIDAVFVAFRDTKFILIKNFIFSFLKIIGLFTFVSLGAFGIFTSWMISLIIGLLVIFIILIKKYNYIPKFRFYNSSIKIIGKYSFANYVSGFIGGMSAMILPILILNKLGSEMAAYYYMAMMIAGFLFVIPTATAQSLFAEGSYNEKKLDEQIKKAIKIIGVILVPSIMGVFLLGNFVLNIFGAEYAENGFKLLKVLAFSGIFVGTNRIFISLLKVERKMKTMLIFNIFRTGLILGATYFMINKFELIGIGYAYLIGQSVLSLGFLIYWKIRK